MIILKNGDIVFEKYYRDSAREDVRNVMSVGKSIISALMGYVLCIRLWRRNDFSYFRGRGGCSVADKEFKNKLEIAFESCKRDFIRLIFKSFGISRIIGVTVKMLDINRLSSLTLLQKNGWMPENRIDLVQRYAEIEKQYQSSRSICDVPQVPLKDIFPAVKEIIESFNGICIENLHPELGLGDSNTIEFSFFEYDISNSSDLQTLNNQAQERLLFIGIGYDIIGDWLAAESGRIYFFNKITNKLYLVSKNIYEFFEQDIYKTEYL